MVRLHACHAGTPFDSGTFCIFGSCWGVSTVHFKLASFIADHINCYELEVRNLTKQHLSIGIFCFQINIGMQLSLGHTPINK